MPDVEQLRRDNFLRDVASRLARGESPRKIAMELNQRSDQLKDLIKSDEFLDVAGEPWTRSGQDDGLNLAEVMIFTIRKSPVKTFEDAERGLEIVEAIQEMGEGDRWFSMRKDDYDWMLAKFRETAFVIWNPPDGALLVRQLKKATSNREPEPASVDGQAAPD